MDTSDTAPRPAGHPGPVPGPEGAPAASAPLTPTPGAPAAADAAAPQQTIDWWTRPATRWIAMLAATGLLIYLCWLMLLPFVDVLMWAVVLVVVFQPVHRRIL